MSGAGTFNVQSKSVAGAGTFTYRSSNGGELETGVWISSQLISFDSYGMSLASLPRDGRTFGSTGVGTKAIADSRGSHADRRTCCFSCPVFALVGIGDRRRGTDELRVGQCTQRTFYGRDSTHHGQEWR